MDYGGCRGEMPRHPLYYIGRCHPSGNIQGARQRHTYRVDIHKRFAIGLLERNLAISTSHQQPALDACIPWVQADLWNRTGDWACQSLSKERESSEAGILCFIPRPMEDAADDRLPEIPLLGISIICRWQATTGPAIVFFNSVCPL